MSRRRRIAIVGYGIAGAALSLQLGRRGYTVECFERRHAAHSGGAGLLLAPAALMQLRAMDLEDVARQHGCSISGLRAIAAPHSNTPASLLIDWNASRWGHPCLGLGVERQVLQDILATADPGAASVRRGTTIDRIDSERGLLFAPDGTRFGPFDLVLACDGANSALRANLPALVQRAYRYPWTALTCLMQDHAPRSGDATVEQCFSGAHHVSSWPVGHAAKGEPARLCVSVNVADSAVKRIRDGSAWRDELRHLVPAMGERFESLQPVGPWISLSCHDVVLRRYVHQRLAFVGDAAHSLSPQLGQGARLALDGARRLVDALDRHPDIATALADYDRRQRAHASRYQHLSRWLTPAFQSERPPWIWLRERLIPRLADIAGIERRVLNLLCSTD